MTKNNKLIIIICSIVLVVVLMLLLTFLNKPKEIVTYKVTFNSNGGTEIQEQIVNQGESVQKPTDPTKEGYIFVEWRYDGILFDFSTTIDKNITLVAEWLETNENVEMITVKFDTNGGSTISNQVIEKKSKVTKPANPTKEGYTFKGWFYNNQEFNFDEKITKDIELIAKWEKNPESNKKENSDNNNSEEKPTVKQYTVTFNSNGGSNVTSQKINEGSKATKPANPTKNGYTFAGWTLNGSDYNFNEKVTKNITLVAKWTEVVKNNYTVTFDSNGGSQVSSQTVTEGNKATKPANPTKEGYNFAGWTLNGSSYDFNSIITSNITLVAKWTQKSYSVVANKVDNISPARVLTVYEDGNTITVQTIQYSDGTTLCSGSNPNVNYYAIEGETSLKLVLTNGTIVTASFTVN